MRHRRFTSALLLGLLTGTLAGCGSDRAEVERLRAENERLKAQTEARGRPVTDSKVLAYFARDPANGTLAGLTPGDNLTQAHALFGQESRARTWASEGRPITQYEWDLEGGLTLRVNAEADGRLRKVAVAFANPEMVEIPTFTGLTLGRETYLTLRQRYGTTITTDLQIWGAQGLYTVAQRAPLPNSNLRMEFVYQMPAGMGQGQLDRIEDWVQRQRNPAILEPYLGERAPYMVGLEEVR